MIDDKKTLLLYKLVPEPEYNIFILVHTCHQKQQVNIY